MTTIDQLVSQLPEKTRDALLALPDYMQTGMAYYLAAGIEPGSFLTAVLCNDLRGACMRADTTNQRRLYDYVFFLYNYAPSTCWGSPEKVDAWIAHRGMQGPSETTEVSGHV
ncbi:MAG: hypothetical protein V4636_13010 [Pseudomonadota bacterium]